MTKKSAKKAARKAEQEKRMAETEELDSLEALIVEAKATAVEIRGMRGLSATDLQRTLSDDVLGSTILIAEEFGERDEDHDVRITRIEAALGLGPVDPEEYEAILSGEYTPVAMASNSSDPADLIEQLYSQVPKQVIEQAL